MEESNERTLLEDSIFTVSIHEDTSASPNTHPTVTDD